MRKRKQKSKKSTLKKRKRDVLTLEQFYDQTIESIMGKMIWDLPLVEKDEDFLHVLIILSSSDHVWVVESKRSKKLLGVITEPDVLGIIAPTKRMSFFGRPSKQTMHPELYETADHLMEHDPISCHPTDTVKHVLHEMSAHGVRHLAVVDPKSDELVGEVTLHGLVRRYYESICEICETKHID